MGSLLTVLLPSLVPAISDAARAIIGKISGSGVPQSTDDRVKLMAAETEKLKALAALDAPGGALSQWVANLRGAFRYVAVLLIVLATIAAALGWFGEIDAAIMAALLDLTGACMSFIIGERMYLGLKR